MRVFTYCSYRGSRRGFQYCTFDLTGDGCAYSIVVKDKSTACSLDSIDPDFMEWCENKSNWQTILQKKNDKQYILMLAHLEESRIIEKKKSLYRGPERDIQISDYYMTIAFLGSKEKIGSLTKSLLNQLINDKSYYELFNQLEKTIEKTEDHNGYTIEIDQFKKIIKKEIVKCAKKNDIEHVSERNSLKQLLYDGRKRMQYSLEKKIYLKRNTVETRDEKELKRRKEENEKKLERISNILSNLNNMSDDVFFIVANEYFEYDKIKNTKNKIIIRVDYEYLLPFLAE